MDKFILLFATFFFGIITYGQDHPNTLLWKVTKKGTQHKSYLFGTFHEVSPSFFNTLTNAVSKLNQADKIFVEERSSGNKFIVGDTWTIDKWMMTLTKKQAETFTSFINKANDTSYYNLNPLLLTLTMARLYIMNFCNTDSVSTELMDTYIEKLALKERQLVFSLDSNQNLLLNKISPQLDHKKDSMLILAGIEYMKSMLDNDLSNCRFIEAYKNLDIDYQLDISLDEKSPSFLLLANRNSNWTFILNKAFSSNNCFVAVGFKHLCYRQGLIQNLRKLGYSVTPISSKL